MHALCLFVLKTMEFCFSDPKLLKLYSPRRLRSQFLGAVKSTQRANTRWIHVNNPMLNNNLFKDPGLRVQDRSQEMPRELMERCPKEGRST